MRRTIELLLLLGGTLAAQTSSGWGNPPPAGIGYTMPQAFLHAAPGQIVSLMVYGLAFKQAVPFVASGLPLPTTLGGISVSIQIPFEVFARCAPCLNPAAPAAAC